MKKINKYFVGASLAALTLMSFSSCIKEVEPYSATATEEQVESQSTATEGLLMAMPAYFNHYNSGFRNQHYAFAYGAMMHMRDVLTGDMAVVSSGYDWFNPWEITAGLDQDHARAQYVWLYYYGFIQTANNLIKSVDPEKASDDQLGYLGAAKTFRAMLYLDMAQMYEFQTNDATTSINEDGNDVTGLTVPLVTDTTSMEGAQHNPRAPHAEMAAFILKDLQDAIEEIPHLTKTSKVLPHLAATYGVLARYYMWVGDYANAEKAARNAIDNADVQPMTEDDCLNTKTGFNVLDKWIWGSQLTSADDLVSTGIINWTSWMSNETSFGYAGAGPYIMIDKSMYDRISDSDWRKLEWKAPEGEALEGQTQFIGGAEAAENYPDYASVKFRPGQGNADDNTVGAASAFPIMRVEEMYFIEAEAAAHQDAARGLKLLTDFMKKYRDRKYRTLATSKEDIIDEIVFQKRVELWGEGLTFFDIKRLNMSVTRGYAGTNFYDQARLNTKGRPAWMNFVFTKYEAEDNTALAGWNNPNPNQKYTPWTGK